MNRLRLPGSAMLALGIVSFFIPTSLSAQTELRLLLPDRIRIVERTNLTRRDDGRYIGLLTREVSGHLSRVSPAEGNDPGQALYTGRFFRFERLRRDMTAVARPVDSSTETDLTIDSRSLFSDIPPYPRYYGIPFLPESAVRAGDRWEAWAAIRLQPEPEIEALVLPVVVQYTYQGLETWDGAPAHRIEAQFATRFPLPPSDDPDAPVVDYFGEIAQVSGAHRITVLIPTEAGQSLFLRDEVEEVYRFVDGTSSSYRGPILLFMNGLRSESRRRIAESVDEELSTNDVEGVSVEETDSGVRLTLEALRFFPDQAVLLPDERPRLDSVAQALSRVPDARLLIVGHTADIGSVESQQMLSEQRARTIAGELVRRGIDANRLDLEGRAGREPVASNATESGRAQNRRVEIYVLEQ